jgi:hypothetical protein
MHTTELGALAVLLRGAGAAALIRAGSAALDSYPQPPGRAAALVPLGIIAIYASIALSHDLPERIGRLSSAVCLAAAGLVALLDGWPVAGALLAALALGWAARAPARRAPAPAARAGHDPRQENRVA